MTSVGTPTLDGGGNPYLTLLYAAVEAQGVSVQTVDMRPWRLFPSSKFDVLHIHWPEHIMIGPGAGLAHTAKTAAAALALRGSLQILRSRGVRIVWTVHNIRPHNPEALALQVDLYPWLARTADAVIVHTNYAGQLVRERLGRTGPIFVAHHGNYIGTYNQTTTDRGSLRDYYGFADSDCVLLAFGQIRTYKRLLELASDFEDSAPASAHLLIAGSPKDTDISQQLRTMASASGRITLLDHQIPDVEVGQLFTVADLAIFNYSEIFSSGTLMLALSLELAALVPRQGAAEDVAGRPALFTWTDSPFEVLNEALAVPANIRRQAALEAAETHPWADSARVHISAYEGRQPTRDSS